MNDYRNLSHPARAAPHPSPHVPRWRQDARGTVQGRCRKSRACAMWQSPASGAVVRLRRFWSMKFRFWPILVLDNDRHK